MLRRLVLLLAVLVGCAAPPTAWGPECAAFLQQAEEACKPETKTAHPLVCEGATEGRRRLEARGFGEFESECRAARESLARDLAASTITPEE